MNKIFCSDYHCLTSLGNTVEQHWQAIVERRHGLSLHTLAGVPTPFIASRPMQDFLMEPYTPFESLAIAACLPLVNKATMDLSKTAFILSTTKGNIELLETLTDEKISLHTTAQTIAQALAIPTQPYVISQACVSGVVALQYAQFLLQQKFNHVIVCGADRLSAFVLKGFQSFQAVAQQPCRPFDKSRNGINLGEAAAAMLLHRQPTSENDMAIVSVATTNDANHISGPSRTGEELAQAIRNALHKAQVVPSQVDMISAHGTATPYNDEMEAKAIALSDLQQTPVHSLKSFIGHTLGAAGIIETLLCFEAMKHNQLIPSLQYEEHGVSVDINICTQATAKNITTVLKTASGFGGINAAIILQKATL